MKSKGILSLLIAITLSVGIFVCAECANDISVLVNSSPVVFDQPPVIQNGRTLVPLRAIFEALGASVDWDADTKTVIAGKNEMSIKITIGDNKLYKNDSAIELDVPAQIINSRTLVPVRAISEAFGSTVTWDGDTRTVSVSDSSPAPKAFDFYPGSSLPTYESVTGADLVIYREEFDSYDYTYTKEQFDLYINTVAQYGFTVDEENSEDDFYFLWSEEKEDGAGLYVNLEDTIFDENYEETLYEGPSLCLIR